jgi:voltage-gated potassium channel Kch
MESETGKPEVSGQKPEIKTPVAPASPTPPSRTGAVRFSASLFLIFLVVFFVLSPFVEKLPHGNFIDGSLLTMVLMSGVLATAGSRNKMIIAIVFVAPVIIGRWIHLFRPDLSDKIFLVPGLVFFGFLIGNFLYFILRAKRVDSEVLCAGLSVYLLLGMAWMVAYLLVDEFSHGTAFAFTSGGPDSAHVMSGFTAIYFSFITLTTVGYGDIVPVSTVARMLTSTEAMTGTLFMAVLIARLVSLYSTQPPTDGGAK